MTVIEYHADLKEVQSDAALASLLCPAAAKAPFDRLDWWQGLAEHCGFKPLLAVAREGEAMAALPLARQDGELAALANWYTFRFCPIVSEGADRAALLGALATDLLQQCRRITLCGVPDEDGSASALEAAFSETGWLVLREVCDTNHVLCLKGRNWDAYHAGLPGPLRTTLKRKAKKLDCHVLTAFDDAVWAEYEAIYAESWKPDEGSPAFLRQFAVAESAAGRLRLGIARTGERAVAAQLWTVEGQTAFIHKLAHRPGAQPLSPGTVLSGALFRHVIEEDGAALIDFGTGDDPYKRDWMEEQRPRYRITAMHPRAGRSWLLYAKNRIASLARTAMRV